MDSDDLEPRARLAPARALESLSIAELRTYEERLHQEIQAVHDAIQSKQSDIAAAESVFKS
jgi:uncharacterized small protein (DUF1192 family)